MKDVDAAWLAAAIDGEGSISIKRRGRGKACFCYLSLYNNNELFIKRADDIIVSCYGKVGGISVTQRKNGKNHFRYQITRPDIVKQIILDIKGYLIVKKYNANVVLKFIDGIMPSYLMPSLQNDRPSTSLNAKNYLKGNRGNSEQHRLSALSAVNHHLKGNRGNRLQHSLAGKAKCGMEECAHKHKRI